MADDAADNDNIQKTIVLIVIPDFYSDESMMHRL